MIDDVMRAITAFLILFTVLAALFSFHEAGRRAGEESCAAALEAGDG